MRVKCSAAVQRKREEVGRDCVVAVNVLCAAIDAVRTRVLRPKRESGRRASWPVNSQRRRVSLGRVSAARRVPAYDRFHVHDEVLLRVMDFSIDVIGNNGQADGRAHLWPVHLIFQHEYVFARQHARVLTDYTCAM